MIFLIVSIIAGAIIGFDMMDGGGLILGVVGGIMGAMALFVRNTESSKKHAIVWVVIGSIIGAATGSYYLFWRMNHVIATILGAILGGILGTLVTRAKTKATIKDYMTSGAIITFVAGGFIGHMINGGFFSFILYGILGGGIGCGIAAIAYAKTSSSVKNASSNYSYDEDYDESSLPYCPGCGEKIRIGSDVKYLPDGRLVHNSMLCWKKAVDKS